MKQPRWFCVFLGLATLSACSSKSVELAPDSDASGGSAGAPSATCDDAMCPELVLDAEPVLELLSDGARLYWINGSLQVRGCLAQDCAHHLVSYGESDGYVGSSNSRLRNLDFTADRVVWKAPAGVSSCLKGGGTPLTLVSDSGLHWGLTADETTVYWGSSLDIYRCDAAGCNSTPSPLASGEQTASKLVFQGPDAYWIDARGVSRAPRDGSAPPTLIVPVSGMVINELGIDAQHLYWLGDADHIFSCPLEGCDLASRTELVSVDSSKYAFQVDASGVYWIDLDDERTVRHCPVTGCSESVAVTPPGVHDFALDETFIYWSDETGDLSSGPFSAANIHRLKKP